MGAGGPSLIGCVHLSGKLFSISSFLQPDQINMAALFWYLEKVTLVCMEPEQHVYLVTLYLRFEFIVK